MEVDHRAAKLDAESIKRVGDFGVVIDNLARAYADLRAKAARLMEYTEHHQGCGMLDPGKCTCGLDTLKEADDE